MNLLISNMLSCISFFHSFTMCFPDEIADYRGIDGVMSSDDYVEELLRMVISQDELDSALSYFRVLA